MKVMPTLDGGLSIIPESEADWMELELICTDAVRPSHLAESLADLMDNDSEWQEYVVPELEESFNNQCRFVAATIDNARKNNERFILISKTQAEKWYGAINQARLSLEARYQIDAIKDQDAPDELEPEVRSAYFRDRFYLFLQSMLLEFVIATE